MPNRALALMQTAKDAINFDFSAQVQSAITCGTETLAPAFTDLATYRAHGGYALAAALAQGGERETERVIQAMEDSGLRGLGGAGLSGRAQVAHRARAAAPRLMAVNIDEGEPGTFKDRTYLERDPHRFLEGVLVAAQVVGIEAVYIYLRDEYHGCRALLQAETCPAAGRPAVRPAADRAAPRRRCLHLRRRVGDDRKHRRQARRAAHAPALHRAGGPVRPADAGAQLRDAVLGARHRREGPAVVQRLWPPWPQGAALASASAAGSSSPASSWRRPASRCGS